MKKAYLINLTGFDGNIYGLVDQETWDWINSPPPPPSAFHGGYAVETPPGALAKRFADMTGKDTVNVCNRRVAVDRAQSALEISLNQMEDEALLTVREVNAYAKANKLKISGEITGVFL